MMDFLRDQFVQSILAVFGGVVETLPKLIVALFLIIVGWVFGTALGRVVTHTVAALKFDDWLKKAGVDTFLTRAGYRLNSGAFLGWLVKSFCIIVFVVTAFDVLGLSQVNVFLSQVLIYIPQVVIAAMILLAASIAAEVLGGIIGGATKAVGSHVANLLGSVTRWAIWTFAFIFALTQLGIAGQYMFTLFTGIVAMLALAGGLAFGLGGKDAAADFIRNVREEIKTRRQ